MNKIFACLVTGLALLWAPLALANEPNVRCYVGATVGTESATVSAGVIDLGDNGYLAGGFAGCQAPMGKLVVGIEADATFSNLTPDLGPVVVAETEYLASLRGRLGYQLGSVLIYATAGWAWTDLDITALGAKVSQGLDGFVIGLGAELDLNDHLAIRLEGLRYDFGSEAFANLGGTKTDDQRDALRLGVLWRF